MEIEPRYNAHQVARGVRPDAVRGNEWFLFKNVSRLRLTYQIRLLTFLGAQQACRVLVVIPHASTVSRDLKRFASHNKESVSIRKAEG